MTAQTATDILQKRAAEAERNRADFPFSAQWLDDTRKYFPGATLKYASEGGKEIGRVRVWRPVITQQMEVGNAKAKKRSIR